MAVRTCPRCKQGYDEYPALCRRDNFTEVCPECGRLEAFEDAGYLDLYAGPRYWRIWGTGDPGYIESKQT